MDKTDISALRQNYNLAELVEENISKDPLLQFRDWFEYAVQSGVVEPNAMILSTVAGLKPKARVLLLKEIEHEGFVFYTNYRSHKGHEIYENPNAAMTFFWVENQRQVRIEGRLIKNSEEESNEYFWSRPRGSQIGAWVSDQSEEIDGRKVIEDKLQYYELKFKNSEVIPRPPHWGGYILMPETIEFWQGRPNRLHDRILYTKSEEDWKISRLSP